MPIHGEVRHLLANGALAIKTGVPAERVMFAENGVVIDMKDGIAKVVGAIEFHNMYVDGSSVGEVTEAELKDRRILADEGFVSVFVVMDSSNGRVLSGPEIHAKGIAEDDSVFDSLMPELKKALEEAARSGATDNHQLQQVMRRVVGRFVGTKLRRRPMIIPIVINA
jgi:ribonuclease J